MAVVYVDLISGVDETSKAITGASKANPCVITCSSHGYSNGDEVYIYGVVGMIQLNTNRYIIGNVAPNTFELTGINSTGYTTWSSGGSCNRKGTNTAPFLTVNSAIILTNEIRIAKTTAPTTVVANFIWTANSVTVSVDADVRASIVVGDYIGKTTAAGNGAEETYFRVNAITATTITLEYKYYGTPATETSCKKLNAIATGPAGTFSMTTTAGTILTGGWNLSGAPTQDGETWIKPNNARTTGSHTINGSTGTTILKINIVETYSGIYLQNGGSTITQCTVHAYTAGIQAYGLIDTVVSSAVTTTVGALYTNGQKAIVSNYIGMGYYGLSTFDPTSIISDCKFYSCTVAGIIISYAGAFTLLNCTFRYCAIGVSSVLDNITFSNCTFDTCGTGAITSSTSVYGGILFKTCTFLNCATGFNSTYSKGTTFDTCTFNTCTKGLVQDAYSGETYFNNCSFITPVTYGVERNAKAGAISFVGCTIDGPSIAKAYNSVTSPYIMKQYVFQNSFGKTGTIWGNTSILRDDVNYRTTAPCVAITSANTTTASNLDIKIISSYVRSSIARTYTMWIKSSHSSWAGTLTPKWKLGGILIKTESNITSLTTSYVQYSWTCAAGLITSDGELSIEFTSNTNAYSFYVDDFSVS